MAFTVELRLPGTGSSATIDHWLVSTDAYVGWNQPLVALTIDGRSRTLTCNMPVVIGRKCRADGDAVTSSDVLAIVQAEGDEIPYGRPYARID